ncbi:MAG: hypothetical protein IKW83_02550 [Muribaculaceae bacterium]|nr:hypothetical protein [Muribaculaceae bacterium]
MIGDAKLHKKRCFLRTGYEKIKIKMEDVKSEKPFQGCFVVQKMKKNAIIIINRRKMINFATQNPIV